MTELKIRFPDSSQASVGLGRVARRRGDHGTALEHFRNALALQPDNANLPIEIATELQEQGQFDEAYELLVVQLHSANNPGSIWLRLGRIALYQDDSDKALAFFLAGIQAEPENPSCYLAAVQEYQHRYFFDLAAGILDKGLTRVVPKLNLEIARARLLKARGWHVLAQEAAERLWLENPGNFACGIVLIDQLLLIGEFDRAQEVVESIKAITLSEQYQFWIRRALLARACFDVDQAEQHLQAALALEIEERKDYQLLATVQLMRGDSRAAEQSLKLARAFMKSHPNARKREAAQGGLRFELWQEYQVNPYAERKLREARNLAPCERVAAISRILDEEPHHLGSAICLLIELHRCGAWETYGPPALQDLETIPRVIVQFWDTPDIPDDIRDTMRTWTHLCPDYEHIVFDDHQAAAFIERECAPEVLQAFQVANHPAMRSDLFRLAYLSIRGGIYVDADDACRSRFESLMEPGISLHLLQEDIGSIGNNFLAASAGHPFITRALSSVVENILMGQGDTVWFISGPAAMTHAFCQFYAHELRSSRLPPGVRVHNFFVMHRYISMHLPRSYKQDARHWSSPLAEVKSILKRPLLPVRPRKMQPDNMGIEA